MSNYDSTSEDDDGYRRFKQKENNESSNRCKIFHEYNLNEFNKIEITL